MWLKECHGIPLDDADWLFFSAETIHPSDENWLKRGAALLYTAGPRPWEPHEPLDFAPWAYNRRTGQVIHLTYRRTKKQLERLRTLWGMRLKQPLSQRSKA